MDFTNLQGERVSLVGIHSEGLADMHEYSSMPDFYRYLEFQPHTTLEDTKKYFDKLMRRHQSGNGHYWFIVLNELEKIVGTFGIMDIDWRKGMGEIGYGVSPAYWGKGLFSEALQLVLEYLFAQKGFYRLMAKTHLNNVASIRGLEKNGFKREGVLRGVNLSETGDRSDAVILAILRDEYFAQKCI